MNGVMSRAVSQGYGLLSRQAMIPLQLQICCLSTTNSCLVQRTRNSIERRTKHKKNLYHLYKISKSFHNVIICDNCGTYYKKWHMCPTCYDQTRFETQAVRQVLENNNMDLSKETVFSYRDDIKSKFEDIKDKRVVHVDTINRPAGWFDNELLRVPKKWWFFVIFFYLRNWSRTWEFLIKAGNMVWK